MRHDGKEKEWAEILPLPLVKKKLFFIILILPPFYLRVCTAKWMGNFWAHLIVACNKTVEIEILSLHHHDETEWKHRKNKINFTNHKIQFVQSTTVIQEKSERFNKKKWKLPQFWCFFSLFLAEISLVDLWDEKKGLNHKQF